MIPCSTPGITAVPEGKIGQEMLPFAHIQFDNVRLDESWRLSGPARGFSQLLAFSNMAAFRLCDGFRSGSSCYG